MEGGEKLHLFQQLWGDVSAKHPQQEQPRAGQGLQCGLSVPCLGQNCFCRGRKVEGVRTLWFLFCRENSRDTPSSGLGFWDGNSLPTSGKLLITYTIRSQPSVSLHILIMWGLRSPLLVIMLGQQCHELLQIIFMHLLRWKWKAPQKISGYIDNPTEISCVFSPMFLFFPPFSPSPLNLRWKK